MNGGGNGLRVPGNVKKMIQNIKEIAGNHGDEEIYAMLKECGMDPNETVQKLLQQDTFHEVKRKRDRKKENLNNRETVNSRRRSGPPGRFVRGGQGNYSSRYAADAGGGKHFVSTTENGNKQTSERAASNLPAPAAKEMKIKETDPASFVTLLDNGPICVASEGNGNEDTSQISSISSAKHTEVSSAEQSYGGATENFLVASGAGTTNGDGQPQPSFIKSTVPVAGISGGRPLTSDLVVVWSNELRPPGAIGAIKHEIRSQHSRVEANSNASVESKLNSGHEISSSSAHARMGSKSQGAGKNQLSEFLRPSSSSGHGGSSSSSSRPSSNYGSLSQHVIGPPKGLSKEWKPKATNSSNVLGSGTSGASQHSSSAAQTGEQDHAVHGSVPSSEEAASKIEKELGGLHIKDAQHVIIPNHIHVPESVRTGLSFGSFNAAFMINSTPVNNSNSEKCSKHTSMLHQAVEDSAVQQAVSNDNVVAPPVEGDSVDHPKSSTHVPEDVSSSDADVPKYSVSDFSNSKETSDGAQHSVAHTSTVHSFAVGPTPILGNMAPFDSSDNQARDASRVPSFVVQQPIDPASANFYAQYYRFGEGDGRISPGVPTYNGNAALLPAQTSGSSQELQGGNPVALSSTGQAPLATQAGVLPSNIAVTQQAVPVFRQPAGLPMPHYPANYIPYGPYFSPFYVSSPAIHQFFGNNAFLQQTQAGSAYPGPPTGTAAGVKYPLSQFKPASNSGNHPHLGPGSYGPYGTSPAAYHAGSAAAAAAGNLTSNEDLAGSQYKENNAYTAGQQAEGSASWIAGPGRDLSGLQANSFYNLGPQGQHVTFTPSHASHGSFAGVYHPAQAVTAAAVHPLLQQSQAMPGAADMVGAAPASVYQQPQHATQMNWPNNY